MDDYTTRFSPSSSFPHLGCLRLPSLTMELRGHGTAAGFSELPVSSAEAQQQATVLHEFRHLSQLLCTAAGLRALTSYCFAAHSVMPLMPKLRPFVEAEGGIRVPLLPWLDEAGLLRELDADRLALLWHLAPQALSDMDCGSIPANGRAAIVSPRTLLENSAALAELRFIGRGTEQTQLDTSASALGRSEWLDFDSSAIYLTALAVGVRAENIGLLFDVLLSADQPAEHLADLLARAIPVAAEIPELPWREHAVRSESLRDSISRALGLRSYSAMTDHAESLIDSMSASLSLPAIWRKVATDAIAFRRQAPPMFLNPDLAWPLTAKLLKPPLLLHPDVATEDGLVAASTPGWTRDMDWGEYVAWSESADLVVGLLYSDPAAVSCAALSSIGKRCAATISSGRCAAGRDAKTCVMTSAIQRLVGIPAQGLS